MSTQIPYPGLRPFERGESDIFFGREEQTDQLLRRLENNHFLAVVGPSGCGKSSLVRAGMIAGLETGYMAKAGARWRVAAMRPGASPFRKLAAALLDKAAFGTERERHEDAAVFLDATLRRGPLGLVEALRETPLPQSTNLLLLVDQFEELFRFRATADHDEADAFVALLLQSSTQREIPIYVVITMRSDYLGDCAVFTGLPEALNESQYLTPRLTREQRRSAIVGPARVFGGDVEPQLVNRILNEMGPEPDLLPVFQHLLMRMWTYDRPAGPNGSAARSGDARSTENPPAGSPFPVTTSAGMSSGSSAAAAVMSAEPEKTSARILTLADYEAVGGLANALSKHANEVFDSLSETQQQTAALLFRRLCERGGRLRDVRRPTPLRDIMELGHLTLDEVTPVADAFRGPEHSFLVPSFPEPLTSETVLDITHESLIRRWNRLNKWVELEEESARTYRFLEETARLWKAGKAALWGTPNLEEAIFWEQREHPSEEWAKRYGGDFKLAKEFLESSRKKRNDEEAEAKALQERRLKRAHRIIAGLAVTVFALIGGFLAHRYLFVWDYEADFVSFVKKFGEPHGIGPLTARQVQHRAVSIRIIRRGRWGRVIEMLAVNSRGRLTSSNGIGTYLQRAEDPSPLHECAWKFTYDSEGKIANEMAYNRLGKMVWGFVYSPSEAADAKHRDGYYVGPDGYPKPEKGSAASFVHLEYSKDGYERRILYHDRLAVPMPGPDKAFGQELTYDDQGRPLEMKSLNPDGQPMNDEFGNSTLQMTYDKFGNVLVSTAYDPSGAPVMVKEGWSQRKSRYDENGNEIEAAYFDQAGKAVMHKDGYHRQTITYDDRGNVIEEHFWDLAGNPAFLSEGYHAARFTYNDDGNVSKITYLGSDGRPIPDSSGVAALRSTYVQGREMETAFFDVEERPVASNRGYHRVTFKYDDRGNRTEVAYFGSEGEVTKSVEGYARFTSEYDLHDQLIRQTHYDADGHPTTGKSPYASRTFQYDDRGNQVEEAYFGVDGKPVDGGDGYVRSQTTYDQRGNAISEEYFGAQGTPSLNKYGYSRVTYQYNHLGKETRRTYFGLHNEPVRDNEEKIGGWISEYDSLGNETRREYFDPKGNPAVLAKERYASYKATFDQRGHRIELRFFDLEHGLTLSSDGYAVRTDKYDARGKVTEQAYFDTKLKPIRARGDNYARVVFRYDQAGNQTEADYFGADSQPAMVKLGYHSIQRTFDARNNPVDNRYYDLRGEPVETSEGYARRVSHFDKYGNIIDEAIFKLNGAPIAVGGCSQHVNRYDDWQRLVEERCVGPNGRLATRIDGFAVRKTQYDERGNQTEVAYFGTREEPIGWFGKAQHKTRYGYDSRDNKIEEKYFDIQGKPMIGARLTDKGVEFCQRWSGGYDQAGRLVQSQCIH